MPDYVFALTMGDPLGIGPEITAKTLAEVNGRNGHHGIAVGEASALERGAAAAGLDVEVRRVERFDVLPQDGVLDVVDVGVLGDKLPDWGIVDAKAGRSAVMAIERATLAALAGEIDGVVTGPINKEAIWASGSKHLGHTEMLGELTGVSDQDTMFVVRKTRFEGKQLRVFFATRHMSLRKALDSLTRESLVASIERASRALQVFGESHPSLAVAALNPHGGEGGAFGTEEMEVIRPAVEEAEAAGAKVVGPIPADAVFHQGLIGCYDAILALHHDQGHIPTKTFDFGGTISVTVGLPILRTSVDHGTAFDIAGRGIADHETMRSAYLQAVDYAPCVPEIRKAYGNA